MIDTTNTMFVAYINKDVLFRDDINVGTSSGNKWVNDETITYATSVAHKLADKYAQGKMKDGAICGCLTMEELEGEALLGLCEAANTYDPARKTVFNTWAFYEIRKRVLAAIHKYTKHVSVGENNEEKDFETFFLDTPLNHSAQSDNYDEDDWDDNSGQMDILLYKERGDRESGRSEILESFDHLPERTKLVVDLTLGLTGEKVPQEEIAQQLGVSQGRVSQIISQAKEQMKKEIIKAQNQ